MDKNHNDKEIRAVYDETTIRVYQAYNHRIADEAVELQTFGKSFKMERMTWIKPSFLWMMYRSGWAAKEGQERILAIDISREGFETILSKAILSSFNSKLYDSHEKWKEKLHQAEVRCQFDPERDIYGNPLDYRSIQLGIKGKTVEDYVKKWIKKITDITSEVKQMKSRVENRQLNNLELPKESVYSVTAAVKKNLGMLLH